MASALVGLGSKDIQPSLPMLPRVNWAGSPVIVNPHYFDASIHPLFKTEHSSCVSHSTTQLPIHSQPSPRQQATSPPPSQPSPRTTPRSFGQAIAIISGQTPLSLTPTSPPAHTHLTSPRPRTAIPDPSPPLTEQYLLDVVGSVQSTKGDLSKDQQMATQREEALREQPYVRVLLSNQHRLVIPLDQAEPILAGIERIVGGAYPDAEERCSIRAKRCILLVAVKLDDGGLFPCICQTDADAGTFELRQGWEAVLAARKLKAGDIVGVNLDQFSCCTCIILHVKVWDNAPAEMPKGEASRATQTACTGAAQLNLARNGTLSLGTGVVDGPNRHSNSTIRAHSINLDMDDAIAEVHGVPPYYGGSKVRRRPCKALAPLAHSQRQIVPTVIRPPLATGGGFKRFVREEYEKVAVPKKARLATQ